CQGTQCGASVRNSLKSVTWSDRKKFMADLRSVYQAATREAAEARLRQLHEKWGDKYAIAIRSSRHLRMHAVQVRTPGHTCPGAVPGGVADQLGRSRHLFRLSGGDPSLDLHHQRGGRLPAPAAQ